MITAPKIAGGSVIGGVAAVREHHKDFAGDKQLRPYGKIVDDPERRIQWTGSGRSVCGAHLSNLAPIEDAAACIQRVLEAWGKIRVDQLPYATVCELAEYVDTRDVPIFKAAGIKLKVVDRSALPDELDGVQGKTSDDLQPQ